MRFLAAAAVAALATCAHASDLELTADEIRARMIGNTIVGIEEGEFYAEYLSPNGAIYGRNRHEAYQGYWRIAGNKLCFAYESDSGKKVSWNCVYVALTGDKVIWNDDNETSFARLLPGRAEKTAAQASRR
ncbi:hypothetical protein K9U40_01765 [Xanthobacter autotrophicus]|uniref:hypothetical protein n=1 Tax=Xanthobacter TaxID=279 RepID=UPI0024ABA596|nr:hypothetical protein [Xanthobacter autotrophicus]MDI4663069.1 hypothetical protein [Xanthobacter autotrophicus]